MESLNNVFLAFWNLDKCAPTVREAREALAANRLNVERAEDVPTTTAFRRAAKAVLDNEDKMKSSFFKRKADDALTCQIDVVAENGDGRLHRENVALYVLADDRPHFVSGQQMGIPAAFDEALRNYTGGDVSKIVKDIMDKDGLGAYSPRKNGGVYFVPVRQDASDLLDRLERFCESIGIRFLRYSIPDTGAQRDEISEAIADSMTADVQAHVDAIGAYTTETAMGHCSNRREAMEHTLDMIGRLAHLLGGAREAALRENLGNVFVALDAKEAEINAARATQQQVGGGRRIVRNTPMAAPMF